MPQSRSTHHRCHRSTGGRPSQDNANPVSEVIDPDRRGSAGKLTPQYMKPIENRTGGAEPADSRTHIVSDVLASGSWWLLYGVIVLSPLVVIKGLFDFSDLPQASIVQTGTLLSGLLLALAGWVAGELRVRLPRVAYPFAALLLWSLVSLFWSTNVYEGVATWRSWAAAFLIFLLVAWHVSSNLQRVRWLLGGLFLTGGVVGVIGVAQHLFGLTLIPQVIAPAATFANKNMAVHFLILVLPLVLLFFVGARRRVPLWGSAALWTIMVTYLCFTRTRAGWVAFAAECCVVALVVLKLGVFRQFRWRWEAGAASLMAVLVVPLAVNLGPDGLHWRLGRILDRGVSIFSDIRGFATHEAVIAKKETEARLTGTEASARRHTSVDVRLEIWMNTLEMIKDNPVIGVGLGNHKVHYPHYRSRRLNDEAFTEARQLVNAHNDYLQVWAELGTVGMVLLGWSLVSVCMLFSRRAKDAVDSERRLILLAIGVALVGVSINALFCFPFHRAIPPAVTMAFLGIAAGLSIPDRESSSRTLSRCTVLSKGALSGFVVCTLAVTLVLGVYTYRALEADRKYLALTHQESAADWPGVVATGHEALRLDPFRKQALSSVGRAFVEMGQYQMGVDALKVVVAAYPYNMNALLNLGVAYGGLKNYDKAIEAYQRVIAIKDDYAKVHYNLGTIYMERSEYDRALDAFLRGISIEPANARMHYGAGLAASLLGKREEGLLHLRTAHELDPNLPL